MNENVQDLENITNRGGSSASGCHSTLVWDRTFSTGFNLKSFQVKCKRYESVLKKGPDQKRLSTFPSYLLPDPPSSSNSLVLAYAYSPFVIVTCYRKNLICIKYQLFSFEQMADVVAICHVLATILFI